MSVFEAPVDVDIVVVPKVRLRVSLRLPDNTLVPLEPVPPKPEEKAEGAGDGEKTA